MANLKWLRIPAEMQKRRQWCVATLAKDTKGKPDKAPRNPHTGALASSIDPSSWASFEECVNSGYPAIGYILTEDDPYTIIDLDVKPDMDESDQIVHRRIYENFHSYAERSQSGLGLHIIVRAELGGGRRRGAVELYDRERFMICTGDIVKDEPIREYQEQINELILGMPEANYKADLNYPERYDDDEIIRRASSARNGDKFKRMFFEGYGPNDDKSQVDSSLAQILAFYSRNQKQLIRLWRRSALYRTDKGKSIEHYEGYYLARTFARAVNLEAVRDADIETGRKLAEQLLNKPPPPPPAPTKPVSFPPGLVGEVASFIYQNAQRPVAEIALAGALTFCAGIFGRQFNVSGTGLNLYIVLIAETGRGKEGAPSGIDALTSALRPNMPIIDTFRGPGHIASGQALIRALDEQPAQFAFLSEFGHMLKIITDPRASAADIRTRQVLLDIFSKSGQHQILQSSIYADKEKNTKSVTAPCFSFMGDTTPSKYYGTIDDSLLAEGLIPRFLTINYDGPRVPKNKNANASPPPELVDRITQALTSVANMFHSNAFQDIRISEAAQVKLDAFDQECDSHINSNGGGMAEVWNRAHLKVLRLSGLVAVGCNHFEPIIDEGMVDWAENLIREEMHQFQERLSQGDLGEGEVTHLPHLVKAVKDWVRMPAEKKSTYGGNKLPQELHGFIPYDYLRRRFRPIGAFAHDRRGGTQAAKAVIQDAIELNYLEEVSPEQIGLVLGAGHSYRGKLFSIGSLFPM